MTTAGTPAKKARRIAVAIALLIASPLYVLCGRMHVCVAGHMQHAPYPVWDYVMDGTWIAGFVFASVFCWTAGFRLRTTLCLVVMLLIVSRLLLGSGGGMHFEAELVAVLVVAGLAVRNLFSGAPDCREMSVEQLRLRRHKIIRGWAWAGAVIVTAGVLLWAGPGVYRFFKTATAQGVEFTDIPDSRKIRLKPGNACIIHLPGGKTVALWCTNDGLRDFEDSDLSFHYGEVPFKELESEEIQEPDGGMTYGEYLSYIRSGSVQSGNDSSKYTLFVDNYALSIDVTNPGEGGKALPLKIAVRQATEKEMIPAKEERAHYLEALRSTDPKIRLDAIRELSEMVSLGSTYAGDPKEIVAAIRPSLKDADAGIRKEALMTLRGLGDDEAILEMLTPRPVKEFSERNGAWTIAQWCRKGSDRVANHVMKFLETDDASLQEFALAFFSCYETPPIEVRPYVAKYLKSSAPEVRAAAASAINQTCDRTTAAALFSEALGDTSDKVVLEALKDIDKFSESIPAQRVIALLARENPEVRAMAADALEGWQTPDALDALLTATRDGTPRVRAQAAGSLGVSGNERAYGRLLELLKDSDEEVRESAVNGLGWMERRDAISAIAVLAEKYPSAKVRQMAKRTVHELRGK